MELKVQERIMLVNLLAGAEGDVMMLRIVRDLQNRLGFTEEELEALEITRVGSQMQWKASADRPVEIEIGKRAHALIADMLRTASKRKALTLPQLGLYERFVGDEDSAGEEGD